MCIHIFLSHGSLRYIMRGQPCDHKRDLAEVVPWRPALWHYTVVTIYNGISTPVVYNGKSRAGNDDVNIRFPLFDVD